MVCNAPKRKNTEITYFKCAAGVCCEAFGQIYHDKQTDFNYWTAYRPFVMDARLVLRYYDRASRIKVANGAVAGYPSGEHHAEAGLRKRASP